MSARKRQRLGLAHAYDLDARVGVVTVEVRGKSMHQRVLREVGSGVLSSAALELALSVARAQGLQDLELLSCDRLRELPPEVVAEFGGVRLRKVPARKNQAARRRAHRLLRELVPLRRPVGEPGLAEWGIDLEIARWREPEGEEEDPWLALLDLEVSESRTSGVSAVAKPSQWRT